MKGPYERLKYDLRRVWECPACRHKEWTGGEVSSRICGCQGGVPAGQKVPMRMVEEGGRRVDGQPLLPRQPSLPRLDLTAD